MLDVPLKTIQKQRSVDKRIVEPVFVVCRYGNDSQAAVRILKEKFGLDDVYDIVGGLNRWASDVDPDFPVY
jgi:adenylyltransferase/sulfurtransferase